MASISNNVLSIEVSEKGAELQSIFNKAHQVEYMWSGDPAIWGKKSPVLFPIVGELKNKKYTYDGKEYTLSRHGFARDKVFQLTDQTDNSLTFSIKEDEHTLEVFPFHFIFSVKYVLTENVVEVNYIIENTGNNVMYFSVGGHPAFKVPFAADTSFEDYILKFEKPETAGRFPLSKDGLIELPPKPLLQNANELPLKRELFIDDAVVFKHLQSSSVSLVSNKTTHGLKVSFKDFPFLGIWQAKGGDFVCIEPWCGIADSVNASGNIEEKEGINSLETGKTFTATFKIELF